MSTREWPLPSDRAFSPWMTQHLVDKKDADKDLFSHQAVVKRFLADGSPYRGILLYHAVGTGKTRTALAVALVASSVVDPKDVVVMLPAFLHQNFDDEIKKAAFGGSVTFVHYNGVSAAKLSEYERHNPFAGKVVIIDEVHLLTSMAVGEGVRGARLYRLLVQAPDARIIALSATPLVNRPHELAYLMGIVKGYAKLFSLRILDKNVHKRADAVRSVVEADPEIDQVEVDPRTGLVCFTRLPHGFAAVATRPGFVTRTSDGSSDDQLSTRIAAALSAKGFDVRPASANLPDAVVPLPLQADAFNALFIDEQERSLVHRDTLVRRMLGCVSYFEHYGDRYPQVRPTHVVRLPLSEVQWLSYEKIRFEERKMEDRSAKRDLSKQKQSVFDDGGNVYRAFSRALCNFGFPHELSRPWPSSVRAMLKEAELEGDVKLPDSKIADKEYQLRKARVMTALQAGSGKWLRGPGLQELSPKFVSIIKHATAAPGPVLVYSQFRAVEGVGLLKLALDAAGWREVSVDKKLGKWRLLGEADEKDTSPLRYITFDDDKERTDILKAVFNDEVDKIPKEIRASVRALSRDQAHGGAIKLLMITERGATGISLRNVRQVHIMEPFWNDIRTQQVIGRAVRADSHAGLPLSERVVDVYQYVMQFTPKQLQSSFTIRTKDHGQTTDEYIIGVAARKAQIIQQLLGAMRSAAFDCKVHAAVHPGVKCHSSVAHEESAAFDVSIDVKRENAVGALLKKLPPASKARYDGRVYAYDPVTKVLYDHKAYERGVRIIRGVVQADGRVRIY